MSDILQKVIFIVAGVVLAVTLVFFVYTNFMKGRDSAQGVIEQNDKMVNDLVNDRVLRYDGATVTGSEVINLITSYRSQSFGIIVTIGSTHTNYCMSISGSDASGWTLGSNPGAGTLENARDISKTNEYINPTSNFKGAVLYDTNGNPVGLHFTLQ